MRLFAGIDGGQSHTQALIGDERGNVLGSGRAGPADEVGADARSTKLRDALEGAVTAALADAKLARDARLDAVVAGVSGYEGRVYGAMPAFGAAKFVLMHDAPIAHAGALGGEPGIIVIAGTGSSTYGVAANGDALTVGGWGYLFGDEGSGFWIAIEALKFAMSYEDAGRGDGLAEDARRFFSKPTLHAIARAFYVAEISRTQIAEFAPRVLEFAGDGHAAARGIVHGGAAALVGDAAACASRLRMDESRVAFVGGMTNVALYSHAIDAALVGRPELQRVPSRYGAAAGALLLAYREAGLPIRNLDSPAGLTL